MPEELSLFIKREIEKRGLSERELSRRAKLSPTAVHQIVNKPDSTPTIETCAGLAKALDVPLLSVLQLAGYGEVNIPEEVDAEITAFAVYLNNLPEPTRTYALEACWSVVRLIVLAASEQPSESEE